jgi:hypothetical protein
MPEAPPTRVLVKVGVERTGGAEVGRYDYVDARPAGAGIKRSQVFSLTPQ